MHDVIIIGGGPAGLMAAFYCGTAGIRPVILEALDFLGGQAAALYPEKPIYDIPGVFKCTGQELAHALIKQVEQMNPIIQLNQWVEEIQRSEDGWVIHCRTGASRHCKMIIIATGKGAFSPVKLGIEDEGRFFGKGLTYTVNHLAEYQGKNVLVVGGGDSALDWSCTLKEVANHVSWIHRRNEFRARITDCIQMKALMDAKGIELLIPYEIKKIHGVDHIDQVTLVNNETGEAIVRDVQRIVACTGYRPMVGTLKKWELELSERGLIQTHEFCKTNRPGILAIGDATDYPGKRHLLVTEFAEAAVAAKESSVYLYGKQKSGREWWGGPAAGSPAGSN